MNSDEPRFDDLSERVLGAVFEVANTLRAGFLEKVYERALMRELGIRGIPALSQVSYSVSYKGFCVGDYFADIVVNKELVVEIKCVDSLAKEHMAQCLNYLRASGFAVAFWLISRGLKSNGSGLFLIGMNNEYALCGN